jgi:hypothetical protein
MLDTPTLQCNRISFCRRALVQNRQQIFKFASIGHGATPVFDHRPATTSMALKSTVLLGTLIV